MRAELHCIKHVLQHHRGRRVSARQARSNLKPVDADGQHTLNATWKASPSVLISYPEYLDMASRMTCSDDREWVHWDRSASESPSKTANNIPRDASSHRVVDVLNLLEAGDTRGSHLR